MKQRLGLAAALLQPRELLVLDEPTNGLDPQGTREVRHLVRELAADGTTVLVSSHLLAEVEQVATHVGIMAGGRLLRQGTARRGPRRRRRAWSGSTARTPAAAAPVAPRARACAGRPGPRTATCWPASATCRPRTWRRPLVARRGRPARADRGPARPGGPVRVPHRGGLRCPPLTCSPGPAPRPVRAPPPRRVPAALPLASCGCSSAGAATWPCWSCSAIDPGPHRHRGPVQHARAAGTGPPFLNQVTATACSWSSPR